MERFTDTVLIDDPVLGKTAYACMHVTANVLDADPHKDLRLLMPLSLVRGYIDKYTFVMQSIADGRASEDMKAREGDIIDSLLEMERAERALMTVHKAHQLAEEEAFLNPITDMLRLQGFVTIKIPEKGPTVFAMVDQRYPGGNVHRQMLDAENVREYVEFFKRAAGLSQDLLEGEAFSKKEYEVAFAFLTDLLPKVEGVQQSVVRNLPQAKPPSGP